jgi:hypothetical protein
MFHMIRFSLYGKPPSTSHQGDTMNAKLVHGTDGRNYVVQNGLATFTTRSIDEAYEVIDGMYAQEQELAAEAANERWFEERGGSNYAGSDEEARDRFMDSLIGL